MINIAIDFEYCRSAEPDMGLLSCALHTEDGGTLSFWLYDPIERMRLVELLVSIRSTHVLIGYEIQLAEARCLAALGLDPCDWHWRDLLAEWRWLRNETNRFKYGHIVKGDRAYFTEPPARRIQKRMTDEELTEARQLNAAHIEMMQSELSDGELAAHDEAGFSMLDCMYFFEMMNLAEYRAAAEVKATVRDGIILSGSDSVRVARRAEIQAYNASDVKDLLPLADKLAELMFEVNEEPCIRCVKGEIERGAIMHPAEIQRHLGDWAARLAKYAQRGIPLDPGRMDTFLEVVPKLTQEIKESWNKEHSDDPLYRVGLPESILAMKKRSLEKSPYISGEYTKDTMGLQRIISKHCKANGIETWLKTRSGVYATDKETLGTFASGENIIKQLERHQGQLSNLKAFTEGKEGEIEAFRYIGSDCRQRPDFGVHGTQTDRSAHKAKSLLFANAHWMRVLINPPEGMALVELDYGSEEVFIGAALSGDEAMMAAYKSNDFYMYYAQLTGMYPADLPIPTEAQRDEEWFKPYKITRNIAKTLLLSIQYGAGVKSIANAIAAATGTPADVDAAQEFVAQYRAAYPAYGAMVAAIHENYQDGWSIVLSNGWRLGPDSPSVLSASNLPVQGTGSVILQEACKLIDRQGIEIIATMHDSITAQCKVEDIDLTAQLMDSMMRVASKNVLGIDGMKIGEPEIVRHGDWWAHGKGIRDWPRYKAHFGQ